MKENIGQKVFQVLNVAFMAILAVFTLYPMAYVAFASVSIPSAFLSFRGVLLKPQGFTWTAYKLVLSNTMVLRGYLNTAVMVLYYGVAHWNSWFNAMIFIRKRELFPLQLVLREILIQNVSSDMTMSFDTGNEQAIGEIIKYALIIVATVPILALYPFLQKYFVKGVLIGAIKE